MRNGFEAHVFTFRIDSTPKLEYKLGPKCGGSFPVVSRRRQKKVKSNEDVSESAKNYEKNKRQRVFQNSWKQGRTWLVCEDNAMFCSVCKEAAAVDATISHKNSFTSGNCQ